jgi:hypothetical protein
MRLGVVDTVMQIPTSGQRLNGSALVDSLSNRRARLGSYERDAGDGGWSAAHS